MENIGTETINQEVETETTETQENGTETTNQEARTFTQEEVDSIVLSRVNREKAKFADYDDLKAASEKYKNDFEEANGRADALQKQLDDLNKENAFNSMKAKVSKETSVPVELLTGENEEACRKQAEAILKFAKPTSYPGTKANDRQIIGHADDSEMRDLARKLFKGE